MKKIKLNRKKIKFEYELIAGTTVKLEYMEPTTEQIDASFEADDTKEKLEYTKNVLSQCLASETAGDVEKVISEQTLHGNLYTFKMELDIELGKLKKPA